MGAESSALRCFERGHLSGKDYRRLAQKYSLDVDGRLSRARAEEFLADVTFFLAEYPDAVEGVRSLRI